MCTELFAIMEEADDAGEIRITLVWAFGVEFKFGATWLWGAFICPVLIIFRDVTVIGGGAI